MRKPVFGVSYQVRHKPAVQPKKKARGLKFEIKEEEGLHYLCSENKGADQLRVTMQLIGAFVFGICFGMCTGFLMRRLIFHRPFSLLGCFKKLRVDIY